TVPRPLSRIPMHNAFQMRTYCRHFCHPSLLVTVDRNLVQSASQHGAASEINFVGGLDLPTCQPVSVLSDDVQVFSKETVRCAECFSRWIVQSRPWILAADN